ncbi:anthrone oxygenase family protein [Inquilinus sp. NPDC058860]|uniref:anthrone oxygenase family protein n=1 Tax=Inquilinus sp. NPDC058860 TaxID=3346652 RepID=UPI0036BD79CF
MRPILQVLSLCLVALAMTPALAHALERPGKMRLDKEAYLAVQPIYYPGFTWAGGLGEAAGIVIVLVLLLLTPAGGADFWWVAAAFAALVAMHAAYWLLTHPVNGFWLRNRDLKRMGRGFFAFDPLHRGTSETSIEENWTVYRDRWERSHVVRAVLAAIGFLTLAISVAL